MTEADNARVALRFVNEINRHDVEALVALLSDDHVFVDVAGRELRGRERVRDAWRAYFARYPDYRIAIDSHVDAGVVVGLFGTATGTCPAGTPDAHAKFKIPAAWRAVVRDGRVERWQVYCDATPMESSGVASRPGS